MRKLMILLTILVISGCQSKNVYYWGDYNETLYVHYQTMSEHSLSEYKETLLDIVEISNNKGKKIPPTTYFELGYIELVKGNNTGAENYLYKERELYPESNKVVEMLLKEISLVED